MSDKCENHENCEDCTHDCSTCGKAGSCDHKAPEKLKPNNNSKIKHVIGVVSGKGGVGKSLVCALLATKLNKQGKKVGILDADVTGPSVPKIFGVEGMLTATEEAMNPKVSNDGVKMVSANLILENPESPVAWRGPVVSGAISQFFNMTNWGNLDVLLVDMPPGTSDVFLTVMQMIPVDGIICVSTPQDLVEMIVGKAINLSNMMNVNVLGLVENMSYFKCEDCGKKHEIYGPSKIEEISKKFDIEAFDKLPINPEYAKNCDNGTVENINTDNLLENCVKVINKL